MDKTINYKEPVGLFILILVFLAYTLPIEYLMQHKPFLGLRFWGLVDGFSHSFIGSLILFPLFREYNVKTYTLAFLSGGILDFDHVAVVHSLDFKDIMMLIERPPTHSITFAIVLAAIVSLFAKNKAFVFCWIFIAITQHVLRDAITDVTPLLYPLRIMGITFWLYILGEISLFFLAAYIGKRVTSPFRTVDL